MDDPTCVQKKRKPRTAYARGFGRPHEGEGLGGFGGRPGNQRACRILVSCIFKWDTLSSRKPPADMETGQVPHLGEERFMTESRTAETFRKMCDEIDRTLTANPVSQADVAHLDAAITIFASDDGKAPSFCQTAAASFFGRRAGAGHCVGRKPCSNVAKRSRRVIVMDSRMAY